MRRKALLIGAQTNGLTGVEYDVSSVAETLAGREFETVRCEGAEATRDGILDAYEELIGNAGPDDAIFVYYSGHGGFIAPPSTGSGRAMIDMQFIVPYDYHESTEDDFRGITSVELSALLGKLTSRTPNVVVALDCCHSARMSRGLLARALPRPAPAAFRPTYEAIRKHIAAQPAANRSHWDPLGHADAVRIVACAPEQSAYEYTNDEHLRTGLLTESLVLALREFGDLPVDWSTVMDRVRRRVLALAPNQRPEVEGPARRLLFGTGTADLIGTLPVVGIAGGRVRLDQAPLLGVEVGDEFMIMPVGAVRPDRATMIGEATVDKTGPMVAFAPVRLSAGHAEVPAGAQAHRTRAVAPALPVHVTGSDLGAVDLSAAITASAALRVAEPAEPGPVEVRVTDDGSFVLCDLAGPLRDPRPAGSEAEVVRDLERVARATTLRTLAVDDRFELDQPVTVEWGRVTGAGPEPLSPSGAVVHIGESVYVRVRNDGEKLVHVSMIDIGVAADITVLTAFAPSGVALAKGEEYLYGADPYEDTLTGTALDWPAHLDPAQARPETILVLVTSAPQDVGGLQQTGVRGAVEPVSSPLDRVFVQVATATRDLVSVSGRAVTYTVRTIDFDLVQSPPLPADEGRFQLDERPAPELRIMSRSARGALPALVAVRLTELSVHHNRAWGGADIRVDAVVLTGRDDREAVYRAQTERFSNIRDGERLPLDRLLMYHGPAVDFLDLAIWVVRDTKGSRELSDLLQERLTSTELQGAGAQLLSLAGTASHAGLAMAAAGAGAIVINTAYQLLTTAVGQSIGVYRTSLLASEQFGVGRHPRGGLLRAQDFSFAYTVESVD